MAQQWSYLTRPAKWIERHILIDTLTRLSSQIDFSGHRYVGMGGLEFIDFQMMHRTLGVHDLISIERNTEEMLRYEANVPYRCVSVEFGDTAEVLPTLPLEERPAIVWLDYQDPLSSDLLAEIVDVSLRLVPTSLLVVTLNAEPGPAQGRVERIKSALGEDLLARYEADPKPVTLTRSKLAPLQSTIIRHEVTSACEPTSSMVRFLDVMYQDGACMQTLALLVDSAETMHEGPIRDMDWSSSEYVRMALDVNESTAELRPPMLTQRERHRLDRVLPFGPVEAEASQLGLRTDMAREYARMYRWYPQYASVSMGS